MPSRVIRSYPLFSPRQLFTATQGAWYEPLLGSMWQENTGVTATTAAAQTIGLLLDQSTQLQIGPELITNGDGSSLTGWTVNAGSGSSITSDNGEFHCVSTGNLAILSQTVLTSGKVYQVKFDYRVVSGLAKYSIGGGAEYQLSGSGSLSVTRRADGTQFYTNRWTSGSPAEFYVDNISIKEIAGNHAAQATAANRPTLQYNGTLPLIRHDSNDVLTANLPNLGGGVFSSAGSVYFATPQGMSSWNNQAMGLTYNLPALNTDWYSCIVLPARLNSSREKQLERYMLKLAGLIEPDYLLDDTYAQLLDDESYNILRA